MLDYLKLIRVKNLVIIGLTLYLIRYFVVLPILETHGIAHYLSDMDFLVLVFSLILVGILFNGHQVAFIVSANMFTDVLKTVFWLALAPCCWIVAYLRLRETEV